jgi:hypothetical protein
MSLFDSARNTLSKNAVPTSENDISGLIFPMFFGGLRQFIDMQKLHATHAFLATCATISGSLRAECPRGGQATVFRARKPTIGKGYDRWPS